MQIEQLGHAVLKVRDMGRAEDFYCGVLGLPVAARLEQGATMTFFTLGNHHDFALVAVGAGFWLELVESGRLVPRARRPLRGVMAAVGMWTVWTVSYLGGFSSTSWYTGFHHLAGHLSAGADQQFSTAVCWLVAAVAFMPVVFWNLLVWLRSEEDVELGRGTPVPEASPSRMGGSPVSS